MKSTQSRTSTGRLDDLDKTGKEVVVHLKELGEAARALATQIERLDAYIRRSAEGPYWTDDE